MFGLGIYARLVVAAIIAIILAGTHWKTYVMGRNAERAKQQVERIQVLQELAIKERDVRVREQQLVEARQQAEVKYVELKKVTSRVVVDARVELGRLRDQLTEISRSRAAEAAAAGAGAHATGAVERDILAACAAEYVGVAAEADRLDVKVTGLQDYVSAVCQQQPTGRP